MYAWIDVHLKCQICDKECTAKAPLACKPPNKFRIDMRNAILNGWDIDVYDWGNDTYGIHCRCPEHVYTR